MKSNLYIIFYLLSNIFRTFDVYLFFEKFLIGKENKKQKLYCYTVFYLVISLEYILIDIPILTLSLNIIGLVVLASLYSSSLKKRILGIGFILALLMLSEAIVASLFGYLATSFVPKGYFSSIAGIVCIPLVSFLLIILYCKLKREKEDIPIPAMYWIMVISVPVSCIFIIVLGFSIESIQVWQLFSLVIIMFTITLSVFLLYEKQIEFFRKENHKNMLEAQNQYYHKQLDALQEMENATKSVRHDMKNHLLTIATLADHKNIEGIREYVYNLQEITRTTKKYVNTGNVVIDGLLNMKMYQAQEKGLVVHVKAMIPEKMGLSDEDCTVLLGNLLDNAMENATERIELSIRYDRKCLIIFCENQYTGERRYNGKHYETLKRDGHNHGLGLQNMERIVKKYDGEMRVHDENNLFGVDIMLYLRENI